MNESKVSVLMPAYNGDQYIAPAIESVLAQSYSNIELIIVDDGSNDKTIEIVQHYLADTRVQLVRNDHNLGLVGNWNRCVKLATGKWIKFLFQDDLLEPSCIERMVEVADKNDCPLVASCRDFLFEEVPQSTRDEYQKFTSYISMAAAMDGQEHLNSESFCRVVLKFGSANFVGEPSSTLIRHDVFSQLGGFNPTMIQLCDLEFWLRIGVNHGIAYVPETLAHFRVHGQSTTSSNASGKRFRKDVVDPLLLRAEFAFSSHYEPLRRVAATVGRNLHAEFEDESVGAQRWAEDSQNSEWAAVLATYPRLRMPIGQRFRKLLRNTLDGLNGS